MKDRNVEFRFVCICIGRERVLAATAGTTERLFGSDVSGRDTAGVGFREEGDP